MIACKKKLHMDRAYLLLLMFDILSSVFGFFSTLTHLQMSDTGVILICFSCRSEMSWTKAHFSIHSAIEDQYVPKIFAQTL